MARWAGFIACAVLLICALASSGQADMISFDVASGGATVTYAGGTAPMIGTGIVVDFVLGSGTPANDGVQLTCDSCTLSFQTGDFVGGNGTNAWVFDNGGSVTITGGLSNGGTQLAAPGTQLLTGTFTSDVVTLDFDTSASPGGNLIVIGFTLGVLFDTENAVLSSFYGTDPTQGALFLGVDGLQNPAANPNPFLLGVTGGALVTAPEPSTLWLLSSGIVSLCAVAFRKRIVPSL